MLASQRSWVSGRSSKRCRPRACGVAMIRNTRRVPRRVSTMTSTGEDSGRREGSGESALLFGRYCALPRSRRLLADGHPCPMGQPRLRSADGAHRSARRRPKQKRHHEPVWRGFCVDDANLRVQMAAVRRALGDDRDVVKTIPGRGYALAAEVATATMSAGGAITVSLPETNSTEGKAKETGAGWGCYDEPAATDGPPDRAGGRARRAARHHHSVATGHAGGLRRHRQDQACDRVRLADEERLPRWGLAHRPGAGGRSSHGDQRCGDSAWRDVA